MSKNKFLLYLDIGLFVSFAVINAPQATGITVHEWLSLIFIPAIFLHILLKRDWVVTVTRQVFKKLPGETRFNYLWDFWLFMLMTTVIVSGLVISEKALPFFGIPLNGDPFWLTVHHLSTALLLATIGIHLAMHWKWIVTTTSRYLFHRHRSTNPANTPQNL